MRKRSCLLSRQIRAVCPNVVILDEFYDIAVGVLDQCDFYSSAQLVKAGLPFANICLVEQFEKVGQVSNNECQVSESDLA